MAVYDVKNAKLCKRVEGRSPLTVEPAFDELDIERFLQTTLPLLQTARDIFGVLCGRSLRRALRLDRYGGRKQPRRFNS